MPNNKHLTLDDRSHIHNGLNLGFSFKKIAAFLCKDPSTISKEIRHNRIFSTTVPLGRISNKCINRATCTMSGICSISNCKRNLNFCRSCNKCNTVCPNFVKEQCHLLSKPPYVCNGCECRNRCVLDKYFYQTNSAHKKYLSNLSASREGLSYTEDDLRYMDEVISPLVKKKQSIHHICVSQADKILCSERTVYKLINQGVLSVRNIDLPRKVRYRPRKVSKPYKVDKSCRIGRTYEDYQAYMKEYPDTPIVQMDSVEGQKGGKVLLTVFFTQSDLLLMFLRDHNTSQSVIDIFNSLDETLSRETFKNLFPVILTDNGSEFSNPQAIEYDSVGNQRTRLFYCNPSSPHQKPEIEKAHEFIRMIVPKGKTFDNLTQSDVNMMACHINSLIRKKLNNQCPITLFSFFHGDTTLHKLYLTAIPPEEVTLSPVLLTALKEVPLLEESLP